MAAEPSPLVCCVVSATASNPCVECDDRPACVKVDANGVACVPQYCDRCHEKLCARGWRSDVWRRTMQ